MYDTLDSEILEKISMRDELVAVYKETDDIEVLESVITLAQEVVADIPQDHPQRVKNLVNLLEYLDFKYRKTGILGDLHRVVLYAEEILEATPYGHSRRGTNLDNLSNALNRRYLKTGFMDDLNQAISYANEALAVTAPEDYIERALILSTLNAKLQSRFERTGRIADLHQAILHAKEEIELMTRENPSRIGVWGSLGMILGGAMVSIEQAISSTKQALKGIPDRHPERAPHLSNLSTKLYLKYQRTEAIDDFQQAISYGREALATTAEDHPERANRSENLAKMLDWRHRLDHVMHDLGIMADEDKLEATPQGDPKRVGILSDLATKLLWRYEREMDPDDQNRAISYDKEALAATPEEERTVFLSNLESRFDLRYQEAISYAKVVLAEMPQDHPDRIHLLTNLTNTLLSRYERNNDISAFLQAISYTKEVEIRQNPDQGYHLDGLANLLYRRYLRTGSIDTLQQSIFYSEEVLARVPQDYFARAAYLNNQATKFHAKLKETGDLEDAQQAISYGMESLKVTPGTSLYRPSQLQNLSRILATKYAQTRDIDDLQQAISYARAALAAAPQDYPLRAHNLSDLGSQLYAKYTRTSDVETLKQSIAYSEEALATIPESSPNRAHYLYRLAKGLYLRYQRTKTIYDLHQAISYSEEALAITPEDDPNWNIYLDTLGSYVQSKYRRTKVIDDLRNSIQYDEKLLQKTPPGDSGRAQLLANLSSKLGEVYKKTGVVSDLQRAITYAKEAMAEIPQNSPYYAGLEDRVRELQFAYGLVSPTDDSQRAILHAEESLATTPKGHPDRAGHFQSLIINLRLRYRRTEDVESLQKAISYFEKQLTELPLGHPDRPGYFCDLGYLVMSRYNKIGTMDDLDQAVIYTKKALAQDSPGRMHFMLNLAGIFLRRYQELNELDDLNQAISYAEEVLNSEEVLQNHRRRARALDILASCSRSREEQTKDIGDLQRSILFSEQVLDVTLTGSDRTTRLRRLSHQLFLRYTRLGALDDLNRAIWCAEEGLEPASAHELNTLSIQLSKRYDRVSDSSDLERSIMLAERALEETPEEKPDFSRAGLMTNLANRLHQRYQRNRALEDPEALWDLENSIIYSRQALEMIALEHPDRVGHLRNMASRLAFLYKDTQDIRYLEEAISYCEQVVAEIPKDHPDRVANVLNQATHLGLRYDHDGDIQDLQRAICYYEEALEATPKDHPDRALILFLLAPRLLQRSHKTNSPEDLANSISAFVECSCCKTSRPLLRIIAAQKLAEVYYHSGRTEESSSVLEAAVLLLPKISTRSMHGMDLMFSIPNVYGIAAEAASAAIGAGRTAYDALKLLELSRGILIGTTIDYRNDLSDLKKTDNRLYQIYNNLRVEVDAPLEEWSVANDRNQLEAIRRRKEAVSALEETTESIRKLPGHEGFQLPLSPQKLMSMAKDGPIVTFASSIFRSDAIIVTSSEITSIALPRLVFTEIPDRLGNMAALAKGTLRTYASRNKKLCEILFWLWDVAVKPVIDELQLTGTDLPHIWWIGVGPLSTAPFHAAGDYSPGADPLQNTMSYAISSYTPNIKALVYAREKALTILDRGKPNGSLLLVTMPNTPGETDLPNVGEEVSQILEATKGLILPTVLEGPSGEQVLEQLESYGAIHFACHSITVRPNPAKSHLLLLKDGEVDKLDVDRISRRKMETAQLAYLSACSTADNPVGLLADESVSIAGGFQLAGFAHVVATMWPAYSEACKLVAADFYSKLFDGTGGGHEKVRVALHEAVKNAQEKDRKAPLKWVPFIHMGA